jgi:hypothetical protein
MEADMTVPKDDEQAGPAAPPTAPASPGDAARRPYATPALVIYGDVVALTESAGNSGRSDGGKGFRRRTR